MRNRPRLRVLAPLLLLSFPALQAQTAHLVRDLDAGDYSNQGNAYPEHFLAARGKLFFEAEEPSSGRQIWVSDGSAAGTQLLAECPEDCSEDEIAGAANDFVFWVAGRGQLWRSDGTRAGSQPLLPDSLRVQSRSQGGVFASLGGSLYFTSCANDCELWRSDGTAAGTHSVKPVDLAGSYRNLTFLGAAAGRLFLVSNTFPDYTLWASDGTAAGTTAIRQIPFRPRLVATTGGHLFLVITLPNAQEQLWASDGTAAGTLALATFATPEDSIPWLKVAGNRVYFVADDLAHAHELWRSDGTVPGTERVTDFGFFAPFPNGTTPDQLAEAGNRIVFLATDGLTPVKLWSALNAATPPTPLAEVCADCFGVPAKLARAGGRVVFKGHDPAHGFELWSTDGTAAGTVRLTDACAGPCDSVVDDVAAGSNDAGDLGAFVKLVDGPNPILLWRTDGTAAGTHPFASASLYGTEFTAAGGKVFFAASDDRYGWELWANDGTGVTSAPVTDIASGAAGSNLSALSALGNHLAFLTHAFDDQVWITGGTAETTVAATSDSPLSSIPGLTVAGGRLYYLLWDFDTTQLWTADGTPAGSRQLTNFAADAGPALGLTELIEHQGHLLFPIFDHGTKELWTSDGTPEGTRIYLSLPAGILDATNLKSLGDRIFFLSHAADGFGMTPWLSDGTAAGTRQLSSEPVVSLFNHPEAVRLGNLILFTVNGLWRSDGTAAGTSRILPVVDARELTVFQNALYFLAADPGGAQSLWRSDGTPAGTSVVKRFSAAESLIQIAGRLFLVGADSPHGLELWTSDGSKPSSLCAAAGRLYFAADDGVHGRELWVSDGTAAGTRMVQDIAPEALSSRPDQLTVAGDNLYFTADDGQSGRELWALPLNAAPGVCAPSPTSLCLSGGRYRVEALWRAPDGRTGPGQAVALTADTGYFWFFGPENVETIVKVLDGRSLNDHVWVFYGALSNVEYSLTVTDTQTGLTRRYFNPQSHFASVGDTQGFGPLGAYDRKSIAPASALPIATGKTDPAAATGSCAPGATRLCLNGGRFAVEATWKDFAGHTGTGTAVGLTGDTGYLWFFGASNVETVIKVLDGRPVNGKFWVFYGALSNVEYTLTVTDTATGRVKTYTNPLGRFASTGDTSAF